MTDIVNSLGSVGNFVWWTGVVEDRNDPKALGRCRVRIVGYHDQNKNEIPTEKLPWAHPITPITNPAMSGVGQTPLGVVPGTWVFGFFLDGVAGQKPAMIGTIPGYPEDMPDVGNPETAGFQDPSEKYPKETERHGLNESDVSRLARYRFPDGDEFGFSNDEAVCGECKTETIVQKKLDERVLDVPICNDHGTFSEPPTKFNARYPLNHVRQSESGHLEEWDDTPEHERLHKMHSSGTFEEIFPKGTKVTKVVKDDYEFILGDQFVNIKRINNEDGSALHGGNLFLTIEGDVYEFVKGNVERQVNGSVRENIAGNYHTFVGGDRTVDVGNHYAINADGDYSFETYNYFHHVRGDYSLYSDGENKLESAKTTRVTSSGGNLHLEATSSPLIGNASGNVYLTSGGGIAGNAGKQFNMTSGDGAAIISRMGGVNLIGQFDCNLKSAAGKVKLNSGQRTSIISAAGISIETPADILVRSLTLTELIDTETVTMSPSISRIGDSHSTVMTASISERANSISEMGMSSISCRTSRYSEEAAYISEEAGTISCQGMILLN
tara:strand:- start:3238 stop:4896 length:1659 start_codon:yes stop_codon:yes gene_type:complete